MKATGLFFLTGRPFVVRLKGQGGDVQAWALPLLERTKLGSQRVVALWEGTAAATYVQIHDARLKRGQALNLELERITPRKDRDGLQAFVLSCALAPDRWPTYHVEPRIDSPNQPQPTAA